MIHLEFSGPMPNSSMTYRTITAGSITLSLIATQFLFVMVPVPARAAVVDWLQGASMVPRSTTDLGTDSFRRSLANLAATGANSVAFVYPVYQDRANSSQLNAGWNTPTDAALRSAIAAAHDLGLSVNLKLHAEVYDGTWRAHIRPDNRNTWYASYNTHLMYLARLGMEYGVDLLTIGTEMVSTAASSENPDNTQRWNTMIANVRGVYSGKLVYGANSNSNNNSPFTNEKKYINFWSSLDYAGISAYYQLNSDSSVEGMKGAWNYWNNNDLRAFQQSTGKPLLFAEIGYRSIDGSRMAPWDWARGGAVNQDEQANAYEALMSYWNDHGYMGGIYWWDWSTNPDAGGSGSGDFTPQNKKAQQVMTKWFTNAPGPGTPGTAPAFGSSGSSNPAGTSVGSAVVLNASIKNLGGVARNNIVDVEVYNASNQKVHQQFFENIEFGLQETRNFPVNWTPQAAGTYRMTIGVFSQGWSTAHHWNNDAASIVISSSGSTPPTNPPTNPPATTTPPTTNPPPTGGSTINLWWPTDGARLSGVQPLKAVIEGRDVGSYKMYWQVDGGTKVEMFNSNEDYPHKEAWVDYGSWKWRGQGPYTLTFTAEQGGSVIASKSINIYTQ